MPRRCAGIAVRPDQDEVVVHHVAPVDAVAFGDELVLGLARVHQQHVGVAVLAQLDRGAGADRDIANLAAALGFVLRQQQLEQPRIVGAGGGRHLAGRAPQPDGRAPASRRQREQQASSGSHGGLLDRKPRASLRRNRDRCIEYSCPDFWEAYARYNSIAARESIYELECMIIASPCSTNGNFARRRPGRSSRCCFACCMRSTQTGSLAGAARRRSCPTATSGA